MQHAAWHVLFPLRPSRRSIEGNSRDLCKWRAGLTYRERTVTEFATSACIRGQKGLPPLGLMLWDDVERTGSHVCKSHRRASSIRPAAVVTRWSSPTASCSGPLCGLEQRVAQKYSFVEAFDHGQGTAFSSMEPREVRPWLAPNGVRCSPDVQIEI